MGKKKKVFVGKRIYESEGTEMEFQRIKSCCLTLVAVLKINVNEELLLCVFLSQKEDTCLCTSAELTAVAFVRLGKAVKGRLTP